MTAAIDPAADDSADAVDTMVTNAVTGRYDPAVAGVTDCVRAASGIV